MVQPQSAAFKTRRTAADMLFGFLYNSCISLRELYFASQSYIAIAIIFALRQELSEVVGDGAPTSRN